MKNIFMEKKFLEYRLNGFLVSFQVWIYENIPAIARKNCCIKHESQRSRMLSWSSNQHVTSVGLRKTIFDLIKLEVNQIVPLEAEKGEEYVVGLFVEDLELRMQSNPIENRLKDVEERIKTNEEVMERLQILEFKVEKMLAGNEGQMNDVVESLPDEMDQVLAGNEEEIKDVASPSKEDRIELLEEVELKDDVWKKVAEVTVAIEAETEIEEGNVQIIDIDDETPDMQLKRQKKPGVLLQSS
ncbi:Hypothetical predicted protein [Olea europaea subsp. europaea]|uniref:Uncharacterized protein n=1 Tax=Olea europaea subsp. europaea TaxID=158383 RepID=A0A8S0TSN9_OLEEU|nr:Hypothetical predicted protein [Olea europaea subsp. europaea]